MVPVLRYFYLLDHLGSTVLMTDDQGNILWQNDFTPFGEETGESGFVERDGFYTGKKIDRNTNLYYFNARWYDPQLGRFITEDPIKDGLNWYAYVNNNPLRYIDPSGLEPEKWDAGGTADSFRLDGVVLDIQEFAGAASEKLKNDVANSDNPVQKALGKANGAVWSVIADVLPEDYGEQDQDLFIGGMLAPIAGAADDAAKFIGSKIKGSIGNLFRKLTRNTDDLIEKAASTQTDEGVGLLKKAEDYLNGQQPRQTIESFADGSKVNISDIPDNYIYTPLYNESGYTGEAIIDQGHSTGTLVTDYMKGKK